MAKEPLKDLFQCYWWGCFLLLIIDGIFFLQNEFIHLQYGIEESSESTAQLWRCYLPWVPPQLMERGKLLWRVNLE